MNLKKINSRISDDSLKQCSTKLVQTIRKSTTEKRNTESFKTKVKSQKHSKSQKFGCSDEAVCYLTSREDEVLKLEDDVCGKLAENKENRDRDEELLSSSAVKKESNDCGKEPLKNKKRIRNKCCIPWRKGTNLTNLVPRISTIKMNEFRPKSKIALKAINTFKRNEEMERLGLGRGGFKTEKVVLLHKS